LLIVLLDIYFSADDFASIDRVSIVGCLNGQLIWNCWLMRSQLRLCLRCRAYNYQTLLFQQQQHAFSTIISFVVF